MVVKRYLQKFTFTHIWINVAFAVCVTFSNSANAEGIVKWVDSHGVTHYGDKLPAQEAGRTNSVLNKQGMVVKRNDPNEAKAKPEQDRVQSEQTRKDTALLASYSSEEEIDIARDRNLQMDEFSLQSQYQRIDMLKREAAQNSRSVAQFNKRKQPIPDSLKQQIQQNKANLKNAATSIITTKKNMEETRQRFALDKVRYAELKPRNQTITDIKYKKKTLAELQDWKIDVQRRLNLLQAEVTENKRAGRKVPEDLTGRIQKVSEERRRADEEIEATLIALKNSEQSFSKTNQASPPPANTTNKKP
jgi:Domain of unknown function (DUF4124)